MLDLLWEHRHPLLFVSKEVFAKALEGWDIRPVEIAGVLAFITLQNGPDFHFQSLGTGHQLSRAMILTFVQAIIDQHGYATTKTPKEAQRQHRFNRLFGFEVVGEDEFDIHYRIERLRHA